jgi:hypothetical protein
MLVLMLSMLALAQEPSPAAAVAEPSLDVVAVTGTPELDAAAAYRAALTAAEARQQASLRERAEQVAAEWRPFWMPPVFVEQAIARFLAAPQREASVRIVDRTDRRREHEFGSSFQTTLWVREDAVAAGKVDREVRQALTQLRWRTLAMAGGTVVFWAVLALVLSWVDRLSRGYMTGRLGVVGVLLGSAVPAVAFVL